MVNMAKKFLWFTVYSSLYLLEQRRLTTFQNTTSHLQHTRFSLFPPSSLESKCPGKRPELWWNCNMHRLCFLSFKVTQNPSLIQGLMKVRLREKTCDIPDCFEQPFFYFSMRDQAVSSTALLGFFLYCGLSCIQFLKFIKFYLLWVVMTCSLVCSSGLLLSNLLQIKQNLILHF